MHGSVCSGRIVRPLLVHITTGEPSEEMALVESKGVNRPMTDGGNADRAGGLTSSASMDLNWELSA